MRTIYTDPHREIAVSEHDDLIVQAGGKTYPRVRLSERTVIADPDQRYAEALTKQGKSPADYYCIKSFGPAICLPNITLDAVTQALAAAIAAQQARANDPAIIERGRISELYAEAARRRESADGENIADYHRLTAQADAALAQWQKDYPEAGREERRQKLLAQADGLRQMAKGALLYDADGSLSAKMQEERHDEMMIKAEALTAEANNL